MSFDDSCRAKSISNKFHSLVLISTDQWHELSRSIYIIYVQIANDQTQCKTFDFTWWSETLSLTIAQYPQSTDDDCFRCSANVHANLIRLQFYVCCVNWSQRFAATRHTFLVASTIFSIRNLSLLLLIDFMRWWSCWIQRHKTTAENCVYLHNIIMINRK